MKRSEINARMGEAVDFFATQNFRLPPFAFWGPAEWEARGAEADEIRSCRLGWDLTDFGAGDFDHKGLLLFGTSLAPVATHGGTGDALEIEIGHHNLVHQFVDQAWGGIQLGAAFLQYRQHPVGRILHQG